MKGVFVTPAGQTRTGNPIAALMAGNRMMNQGINLFDQVNEQGRTEDALGRMNKLLATNPNQDAVDDRYNAMIANGISKEAIDPLRGLNPYQDGVDKKNNNLDLLLKDANLDNLRKRTSQIGYVSPYQQEMNKLNLLLKKKQIAGLDGKPEGVLNILGKLQKEALKSTDQATVDKINDQITNIATHYNVNGTGFMTDRVTPERKAEGVDQIAYSDTLSKIADFSPAYQAEAARYMSANKGKLTRDDYNNIASGNLPSNNFNDEQKAQLSDAFREQGFDTTTYGAIPGFGSGEDTGQDMMVNAMLPFVKQSELSELLRGNTQTFKDVFNRAGINMQEGFSAIGQDLEVNNAMLPRMKAKQELTVLRKESELLRQQGKTKEANELDKVIAKKENTYLESGTVSDKLQTLLEYLQE